MEPSATPRGRSLRARLALVIVALVTGAVLLLGAGASAFVEGSLRDQRLGGALVQADYDLANLLPAAVGTPPSRDSLIESGVLDAIAGRAGTGVIADFGDGDPVISSFDLRGAGAALPADLVRVVAAGQVGWAWTTVAGVPSLVVGGRLAGGPAIWFVHDTGAIDTAVAQLRLALLVGAVLLIVVALLSATVIARGILRPVETAGRAAARMAAGDLSVRLPVESRDELGALAGEFNRMAAALQATIERLRTAENRNRRFVADVSHELRTPLTALVAEASVLRDGLAVLPPDARRAGELLVGDVARLRGLVEDLMELSRFDAGAETVQRAPLDIAARVRALAAGRLPGASLFVPDDPVIVETEGRRFDRILGNLLDNARVHAPGAAVTVALETRGETVAVTVADRGPGIPAGVDPARLFGRFEKADPARPGGSGLGLAIALEHARLLGGTLDAAPNPGGGLVFRLVLPADDLVTEPLPGGDGAVTSGDDPRSGQQLTSR